MNPLDWLTVAIAVLWCVMLAHALVGSVQNRRSPKGKGRY